PEEDLEGTSFAGMYETLLGQRRESLEKAIAEAFSSCFDFRVMAYKKEHGMDLEGTSIAVVVQLQIASDVSGVGFSLNPLNNCYDEVMINASFGLGEAIVSGIVTPDTYIVDSVKNEVTEKEVNEKQIGLWLKNDGGIEEKTNKDPNKQALTNEEILELSALIKKCEKHYDIPMDTEWAFEDGTLYLLQSRPITTYLPIFPELLTEKGKSKKLYLDYNFLMQGFNEQMSVLGSQVWEMVMSDVKGGIGRGGLDGLFPSVHGKTYANLSYSYVGFGKRTTMSIVGAGGADNIAKTLESMDIKEYTQIDLPDAMKQAKKNTTKFSLKMIPQVVKVLFADYKTSLTNYLEHTDKIMTEVNDISKTADFSVATREITYLTTTFLNDMGLIVAGMLAQRTISKMFKGKNVESLVINLGMDLDGNPTGEMGHNLFELASHKEFVDTKSETEFLSKIENGSYSKDFMSMYQDYIKKFGSRVFMEIDVASKRVYEDPSLLYEKLTNINVDDNQIEGVKDRKQEAYDKLLEVAKEGGFEKKFKKKAEIFQSLFGYREHPKYVIVQSIAKLHDKALELGRKLVVEGKLKNAYHIFDLKLEEIEKMEKGIDVNLEESRENNLFQYRRVAHIKDWPIIMDSRGKIINPKVTAEDGDYVGSAVAPGKIIGIAKVLLSPYEKPLNPGEILVTKCTEPSWTPIFINAAGVVMELGGPLQHGGIIAREYGIPCVSGLIGITDEIKDGDLIEVDGTSGIVRVVESSEEN
ncbi:PEP/pyruvate-binding domain-containing protein, partial [Clostridium sp.]|uniref:PEP/pyruvate-binding domain-containing protein n=1 Tax=Clostridium sp. TaxID=1506 RepID=UPI003EEBF30F